MDRAKYGALLVDLDGVLRRWPADNDRRAEEAVGLPPGAIARAAFAPELLGPAIGGRLSDGLWRHRVALRLAEEHPGVDAPRAVGLWSASCGTVDGEVLALVRACRARVRVVLATNATSRLPHDLRSLGLDGELDAVVNSSQVGHAKPAPAFFHAALEAAGAEAERALLVDDSGENVEAARRLGMGAIHFGGAEQLGRLLAAEGLL